MNTRPNDMVGMRTFALELRVILFFNITPSQTMLFMCAKPFQVLGKI